MSGSAAPESEESTVTIEVDAQFSLAASAAFAYDFPGTEAVGDGGAMSFAWALDGEWSSVSVRVGQSGSTVHAVISGATSSAVAALIRRDVERILCADVDGSGFGELAQRDPVVADLQRQFPGLRPVLFYTPYEAAAWCIIGH